MLKNGLPSQAFKIPSLDGIRLVAFLMVFVPHAGFDKIVPGGFGVTIFFFLSGYLITTLIRREVAAKGAMSLRHFFVGRTFRIFPAAFLFIFCAVAYSLWFTNIEIEPLAVVSQITYLSNYYMIKHGVVGSVASGTNVLWSLAVEEHFYLFFPLLVSAFYRDGRRGLFSVGLTALALGVLVWRLYLVHHFAVPMDRTYMATDTRIDGILWGCILALIANPISEGALDFSAKVKYSSLLCAGGAIVYCLVNRDPNFRETWRYTIQSVALMPVFYFAIRDYNGPLFRWLNNEIVSYLGTLTYGLYLYHTLVLNMFRDNLSSRVLLIFVSFIVCFAVAWLTKKFFEDPMRDIGRRIARGIK